MFVSPRLKTTSVGLGDEALKLLQVIADERTKVVREAGENRTVYAGDLIREAVEEYLKRHGHDLSIGVNRGGYRER